MVVKDRRRSARYPTASIPVQLSDINGELIDLSQEGAAVVHRSPIRAGSSCTLIFPSYGGIYIPCQVLRSVVQVRRGVRLSFRDPVQSDSARAADVVPRVSGDSDRPVAGEAGGSCGSEGVSV